MGHSISAAFKELKNGFSETFDGRGLFYHRSPSDFGKVKEGLTAVLNSMSPAGKYDILSQKNAERVNKTALIGALALIGIGIAFAILSSSLNAHEFENLAGVMDSLSQAAGGIGAVAITFFFLNYVATMYQRNKKDFDKAL
jgi:hypothetical protein